MMASNNIKNLDLLSLYETKCASLPKFQKDPRKNEIPKIIDFVQKLYEKSKLAENDSQLENLIVKCKETIEMGGDKILTELLELASFLKMRKVENEKIEVAQKQSPKLNTNLTVEQNHSMSIESSSEGSIDQSMSKDTKRKSKRLALNNLSETENSNSEIESAKKSVVPKINETPRPKRKAEVTQTPKSELKQNLPSETNACISVASSSSESSLDMPSAKRKSKRLTLNDLTEVESNSEVETTKKPPLHKIVETLKSKRKAEEEVMSSDTNDELTDISMEDYKRLKIIKQLDEFCLVSFLFSETE